MALGALRSVLPSRQASGCGLVLHRLEGSALEAAEGTLAEVGLHPENLLGLGALEELVGLDDDLGGLGDAGEVRRVDGVERDVGESGAGALGLK